MSLILDQTWVETWKGKPTPEQKDHIVCWLTLQKKEWRGTLIEFPPFCLVRAKRTMDIPCPFSLGFVAAYHGDGFVAVQQEPFSTPVVVAMEDLEVVGFWKHLDHEAVRHLLS